MKLVYYYSSSSKSKTKIFAAKPKTNSKSSDFLPKFEEEKDFSIFDEISGSPSENNNNQYEAADYKFLDSKVELSNGVLDPNSLCKEKNEYGIQRCFDWRSKDGVNYDTPVKKQGLVIFTFFIDLFFSLGFKK